MTENTAAGMFSSWVWAIELQAMSASGAFEIRHYLREPKIGNDCRLVKSKTRCADCVKCPTEEKQPEFLVFQTSEQLTKTKVGFRRSGCIDG